MKMIRKLLSVFLLLIGWGLVLPASLSAASEKPGEIAGDRCLRIY